MSIYTDWLPFAEEARREEPKRFAAAAAGLRHAVQQCTDTAAPPGSWALVLPWLEPIKSLVSTKTEFDRGQVADIIRDLWEATLQSGADVEVQVRTCEVLSHCLRHYRRDKELAGRLVLPWRPLYEALRRHCADEGLPEMRGGMLSQARHTALFALVPRARRFFPAAAAAEVWAAARPALASGDPASNAALMSLGWLVLFFPTKRVPECDPSEVSAWVSEWLDIWERLAFCDYWSGHWMYLVARTSKDDWKGVVDWQPHLPRLYTHMLWAFRVPVGTATASPPMSLSTSAAVASLFGHKIDQVDDASKSAAKLALHLLKQPDGTAAAAPPPPAAEAAPPAAPRCALARADSSTPAAAASTARVSLRGVVSDAPPAGGEEAAAPGAAAAADALDSLVQLLEQYYHPSNGGSWTPDLAVFLRQGVHYLMKQLGRQCGAVGWPGEARLAPPTVRRFVRAAVKLAARGQHAKDRGLQSACCKALCQLSYVWPEEVLPLVVDRFQAALTTVVATHQLPAAINTLAMCVRPLLLSGWGTPDEPAPQVVAEAMMAVLPGIDANDEAKTAAVFQFYTSVLASLPELRGADTDGDAGGVEGGAPRLPLYLEDWLDQVLERVLLLLANLDTGPGADRADAMHGKADLLPKSTTALTKDTMFSTFFTHLMQRLPRPLARRAAERLGEFACGPPLPSVALEAAGMYRAAAGVDPAGVVEAVVRPLAKRVAAEMPEKGAKHISRSTEDALMWRLVIIGASVGSLPAAHAAPLLPELLPLIDAGLAAPSRVGQYWSTLLVNGLLNVLTCYQLRPDWWRGGPTTGAAPAGPGGGAESSPAAGGLQMWVDRAGSGWAPLPWLEPEPAHVEAAGKLVDRYLVEAARKLEAAICRGGTAGGTAGGTSGGAAGDDAVAHKQMCQSLISGLSAILMGLMGRLEDFEGVEGAAGAPAGGGGVPLYPVGRTGALVGRPGARGAAAAAMARVVSTLRDGGDRDLLEQALAASMLLLSPGMLEQQLGGQRSHTGKGDSSITEEPAAATALLIAGAHAAGDGGAADGLGPGGCQEEPRWRKRSSFMSAVERVKRMVLWRASQEVFRNYQSGGEPEVSSVVQLPADYRELLAEVLEASLLPYSTVRATALATVQAALRRFPCLAPAVLPLYLSAVAGAPSPAAARRLLLAASEAEVSEAAEAVGAFYEVDVREAALRELPPPGGADAAAAAAPAAGGSGGNGGGGAKGATAAEESVNDGRVSGACAALSGSIELLRHCFREPAAWAALLRAALASRVHGSSTCEDALSGLLMQVAARFKVPPCLGPAPCGPLFEQLLSDATALGQPGGALRAALRYCVSANVIALMMTPPPSSGGGSGAGGGGASGDNAAARAAAARHWVGLLMCDMLLLRSIGALGLSLQIMAAIEQGGEAREQLAAILQERMSDPGFGESLVKLLVLGHTRLDQVEAAKGQRGSGGAGGGLMSALMNMGFEELLWFTVSSLLEKGIKWPRDGARPAAVRDGLFEPAHARLAQLLASLCPAAALRALRGPLARRLEAHMQPAGPADKAEHAVVAEVAAGLVASCAPFIGQLPAESTGAGGGAGAGAGAAPMDVDGGGGGGGEGGGGGDWVMPLVRQGLAGCSLEMSAAWAAAARYCLDSLLPPAGAASPDGGGDDDDEAAAAAAAPPGGAPAERGARALLAALLAVPGGGGGAPLLLELKRLRLFDQAVASIRNYEPDSHRFSAASSAAAVPTMSSAAAAPAAAASAPPATFCFAGGRGWRGWREAGGTIGRGGGGGSGGAAAFVTAFRPPKAARGFLGGVIGEVALLMDAREQPSAVQELCGKLLVDLSALMSPSVVPPAAAALGRAGSHAHLPAAGAAAAGAAGADSGASSPIELDISASAAIAVARGSGSGGGASNGGGSNGGANGEEMVLVLNPAPEALAAQLRALAVRMAASFQRQAAALAALKGPGEAPAAAAPPLSAAPAPGGGAMQVDEDSDAVLVPSPGAAAGNAAAAAAAAAAGAGLSEERARAAASQAGLGLNFILHAAYGADAAPLRPLVLSMLRGLLQLQMLSAPGLQQLAADAKRAAVALKYLPVSAGAQCAAEVNALSAAGGSPHWSTRAAAVVHLACFWFRHCFLLGGAGAQALEGLVVGLLQDPKLEVRNVAAATLSGMVRGMTPAEAAALRERLVAQCASLFGPGPGAAGRRRGAPLPPRGGPGGGAGAAGAGAAGAQQHAVVQGLKAFVLSSPYDCPLWMAPVLMALVAAATSSAAGAQVKRDASKALSEFRRTHENDALDELKALLSEDEWDAMQQVTSPATYFT